MADWNILSILHIKGNGLKITTFILLSISISFSFLYRHWFYTAVNFKLCVENTIYAFFNTNYALIRKRILGNFFMHYVLKTMKQYSKTQYVRFFTKSYNIKWQILIYVLHKNINSGQTILAYFIQIFIVFVNSYSFFFSLCNFFKKKIFYAIIYIIRFYMPQTTL